MTLFTKNKQEAQQQKRCQIKQQDRINRKTGISLLKFLSHLLLIYLFVCSFACQMFSLLV